MSFSAATSSVPSEFRTLFLGDLSIHCTEQHIHEIFSQHGLIEQIRFKRAQANHGLCYAFVTFIHYHDADHALQKVNGTMLLGRRLRVNWATPKGRSRNVQNANGFNQMNKPKVNPDNLSTAQIHFSFIARNATKIVTEETVRELFSSFGQVLDVTIKKTEMDHKQNVQSGYGFLHFPMNLDGIHAAIQASNVVQKICINQIRYDCCLTRSLQKLVDDTPEFRQISHGRRASAPSAPVYQHLPAVPFMAKIQSSSEMISPPKKSSYDDYEDYEYTSDILSISEADDSTSSQESPNRFNQQLSTSPSLKVEQTFDWQRAKIDWNPPAHVELTTYGSSANYSFPSAFTTNSNQLLSSW